MSAPGVSEPGAAVAAMVPPQVEAVLLAGGPRLANLLAATEERLFEVAEGHGETLAAHAVGTLGAGGKRLRPMLLFLCAGAVENLELVRAGAAVELVHMATLVHDDVLDRAPLRRGRSTVYADAGRTAATATGDLLFSRAFAELVPTGSVAGLRALSAASSALAHGELMQRADAWSATVTPDRYLARCEHKTARLFEAACRLGATFGDVAAGREEARLATFGSRIGLAFQILDDVLDVSGSAERTGKLRGADLLDGTVTLPLILARARDPELAELDLALAVRTPAQADALCERIGRTGALEAARRQALEYVDDAKAALAGAQLGAERTEALELVADGVVERYA